MMIRNKLDNEYKKDMLLKLSVRELREEAKKLSVPWYSRRKKEVLIDLIIKYQKKSYIEDQTDIDLELYVDENWKINSSGSNNLITDSDSNLKGLLSKYFPDKKITVTDNKDGSQTILII